MAKAKAVEVKRVGRLPLDPDQPIGERAVTVSFSLGKSRREMLHKIRIATRCDSLSTVIRRLIDEEAERLKLE